MSVHKKHKKDDAPFPFFRDAKGNKTSKTSKDLGLRQDQSKAARDKRRKAREAKRSRR